MSNDFLLNIFLFLFSIQSAFGQKFVKEFDEVSLTDFQIKQCPFDTSANAFIVYDKGNAFFSLESDYSILNSFAALGIENAGYESVIENFTFHQERQVRIHVLNNEDNEFSVFRIPYAYASDNSIDKILDLKITMYNHNESEIVRSNFNIDNVQDRKLNSLWREKVIALDDVRDGTIIECSYTVQSPNIKSLIDWNFQQNIPVVYSEYVITMLPYLQYEFLLQGSTGFDFYKVLDGGGEFRAFKGLQNREKIHVFIMSNLDAFKEINTLGSNTDHIIKLDFYLTRMYDDKGSPTELMTSWEDLNRDLAKRNDFGKQIRSFTKASNDLMETPKDFDRWEERSKIQYIVNFVRENFKWNNDYTFRSSISTKEIINSKSGNSGDLNLMLIGLLKAHSIEVQPIILSTIDHGRIWKDYPFESFMNHVIGKVRVQEESFFVDATGQKLAFDMIPLQCLNGEGLLINGVDESWVELIDYRGSESFFSSTLFLDESLEELNGEIKLKFTGYEAQAFHVKHANSEQAFEEWSKNKSLKELVDFSKKFSEEESQLDIEFKANYPIASKNNKNVIYPFLSFPLSENPLTAEYVDYATDFKYKTNWRYSSLINIDSTISILKMPDAFSFENELIKIDYNINKYQTSIEVNAEVNFKKNKYPPQDYGLLKRNFNTLVRILNQPIVTSKN